MARRLKSFISFDVDRDIVDNLWARSGRPRETTSPGLDKIDQAPVSGFDLGDLFALDDADSDDEALAVPAPPCSARAAVAAPHRTPTPQGKATTRAEILDEMVLTLPEPIAAGTTSATPTCYRHSVCDAETGLYTKMTFADRSVRQVTARQLRDRGCTGADPVGEAVDIYTSEIAATTGSTDSM